jgi:type I restriction enzyme S subunit
MTHALPKSNEAVPSGYKQTEVGVIPEEWVVAPLSREIDRLEAGVSVNSVDEELGIFAHEQAVLKTSAISGGQFLPSESKKIAPRDLGRAKLNPLSDTIIISRMNTPDLVGECGYVEANHPNLFLPDRLWMTRNRNGSDICVRWLSYLLSSTPYKTRIRGLATGTSGSMKNIAKNSLLAMPIPYPDRDEQCAIAGALSDVDALIGALDQLIATKRNLKQAAMQQLLTGKKRLPGFHEEWKAWAISRIAPKIIDYRGRTPLKLGMEWGRGNIPALSARNVKMGYINFEEETYYGSEALYRRWMTNGDARRGDIVITTEAPLGNVALIPDDRRYILSQRTLLLQVDPEIGASQFLLHAMTATAFQNLLTENSSGSTATGIQRRRFEKLELSLPPLPATSQHTRTRSRS